MKPANLTRPAILKKALLSRWLTSSIASAASTLLCASIALASNGTDLLSRLNPNLALIPTDTTKPLGSTAPENPNESLSNRIIGGDAVEELAPFMVSIQIQRNNGYAHVCGGTIIGRHKVLTAAHCFDALPLDANWRVYYGNNNLNDAGNPDSTANTSAIEGVHRHPEYVPGSFLNDVAVVHVSEPFNATPINIATPSTEPVFDGLVTGEVFGWGVTDENSNVLSNTLQSVEVPFQTQATCQSTFPTSEAVSTGDSFCAGVAEGGLDACLGDSGGPIIIQSPQGPVQIGIVSFGIGCAREDLYGVYSRVSRYSEWLAAHANGVLIEAPFDFGWVLPTETHAATGIYPSVTQRLRNNSANTTAISAFELQGQDSAQFRASNTDCATSLGTNGTCDLSVELLASIPGQYTARVKPVLDNQNILTIEQLITAEIPQPLPPNDQASLDTHLNVWYTGNNTPFKSATLTGAVNNRGLRSGNGLGAFSALLGIIEGPGQLSVSYQYVPADGERAVVDLNGKLVHAFEAQTDAWATVTINIPTGTNVLSFVIGEIKGEKVDGVLHLDNFRYNSNENPNTGDDSLPDFGDIEDPFDDIFDEPLDDPFDDSFDEPLDPPFDDSFDDPLDPPFDDSFDEPLDPPLAGPSDNDTTDGGFGQSISDFIHDTTDFVAGTIFKPIKKVVKKVFSKFTGIFGASN